MDVKLKIKDREDEVFTGSKHHSQKYQQRQKEARTKKVHRKDIKNRRKQARRNRIGKKK